MVSNITFSVVFYQQFGLDTNVVTKTVNMTTATINNFTVSTSTLRGVNSGIIYSTSVNSTTPGIEQEKLILYIDLMTQLLGIDINFQKFSEMSPEEIKSFTRDLKIKKIL